MKRIFCLFLSVLLVVGIWVSAPITANALTPTEQQLLDRETNKLLAGIKGNASLSEVEKALLIHDRLALTCSYGKPADTNYSAHTAYSAIVLKKAVCQGYALAYQYLLGLVGIKSDYVSSDYLYHGWNIVYINNVPYHVDVTWDDASGYTEEGKVYHKNFLRSTQGMIATGHADRNGAIDYNSTPTSTTYDNYFWQNSSTGFQLLNNEIYFLDNVNKRIMKLNKTDGSDATLIKAVPSKWNFSETGTNTNSFAKLASDGAYLYYSTPTQIIKLNPVTLAESVEYTLTVPPEYAGKTNVDCSFWGLSYIDCTFTYEYIIFELGALDSKTTNKKIVKTNHNIINVNAVDSTCTATGLTAGAKCSVCGLVTVAQQVIPKKAHNSSVVLPRVEPTLTSTGLTQGAKCSVCGTVTVAQQTIPKLELAAPVFTSIAPTTGGVKFTWSAVPNAAKYKIYRKTYHPSTGTWDSKWKKINKVEVKGTEYVDGTAKLGTQYMYLIKAVNGKATKNSAASSAVMFKISPTPTAHLKSNGIKVKWAETVVSAENYRVYRAEYNESTKKYNSYKKVKTVKGTTKSWTDTTVVSGKKYKYCVKAVRGKVVCDKVQTKSMYFLTKPTATATKTANGIVVNWNQIQGATSFKIYRATFQNGAWTGYSHITTAAAGATSYIDATAVVGVQYKYKVKAVKGSTGHTSSETAIVIR